MNSTTQNFKESASAMTITLIGAGNMGGAMLNGWLANMGDDVRFNVVDPDVDNKDIPSDSRITISHDPAEITDALKETNIVLFANKPQIMKDVCEQWQGHIPQSAAIASICAGIPIAFMQHYLGNDRAYI
ncbi:MAG: NAD(P)-binding domain-containing protein, partial [Pseudomonadota bacterium]